MPELKIGKVSLNTGQSGRSIYPFTNTEGLVSASKRTGAAEERQRIRTKVEEMVDAADEKIIYERNIGIDPRAADKARRDGLLELLQWLDGEAP